MGRWVEQRALGETWGVGERALMTHATPWFQYLFPPEEASCMVVWEARLQSFLVPCEHNCEDRFLVRDHLQEPFSTRV